MGDVNLEIKLNNIDERVIKIEESGGSGGDGYITSVSNDFNVLNKKLSLSNDVTTKLSKVDTTDNLSVELAKKINKPVSATNGQVLTYNGTSNEWEAQNSKGGGADTSIISDAYDELKSYVKGNYCIYDNALWKALGSLQGTAPTEGTLWTKVSVSEELYEVNSNLNVIYNSDDDYIYINGKKWKMAGLLVLPIFENGNINSEYQINKLSGNGEITLNNDLLTIKCTSTSGNDVYWSTTKPIDVTNYTKLTVEGYTKGTQSTTNNYFGLHETAPTSWSDGNTLLSNNQSTYTIDLSNLSGKYYFCGRTCADSTSSYFSKIIFGN